MEITKDYLLSIIDHTLLNPNAVTKDLELLCEESVLHGFGAVCVRPCDVKYSSKLLDGSSVKVCTVVGFPWGIQSTESKSDEACRAVYDGASEIDMVMNRSYIKGKDDEMLKKDIKNVVLYSKSAMYTSLRYQKHDVKVKVILETCELTDDEIVKACLIAKEVGADYVKTSTGLYRGATVKAVKLMHETVPDLGVKASGGIKTWEKAKKMIEAGATRLGTSSSVKIVSEFLTQYKK